MPSNNSSIESEIEIFPRDVLRWMKTNAKPLEALKLMKVCKYFQHKNFPYLVIAGISKNSDGCWSYSRFYNESQYYVTDTLDTFADKSLWITKYFCLYQNADPFSSILSKIAICKARNLHLVSQNLTLNELRILSADTMFEYVHLFNTTITDTNDELIAIEDLLVIIPEVKYLSFDQIIFPIASPENAANIVVPNLALFEASRVRESFNFQNFTEFMKTHPTVQCRITYDTNNILSLKYIQQIEEYINKVVIENSIEFAPPVIQFPGQIVQNALTELHQRYHERIYNESSDILSM